MNSQVKYINDKIASAPVGSPLHGLRPIEDPTDEIIEVHISALKWNFVQRRFGLVALDLAMLQQNSVELLELLKSNLLRRTGNVSGWNFEKAHSILHKVCKKILFGWSEDFSTQVIYVITCIHFKICI